MIGDLYRVGVLVDRDRLRAVWGYPLPRVRRARKAGRCQNGPCGGQIGAGDEYAESSDCAAVGNPWQHDRFCADCLGGKPTVSRRVEYHRCEACGAEVPESHLAVGHSITTHWRTEPVIAATVVS
jgi:hypothetical protein